MARDMSDERPRRRLFGRRRPAEEEVDESPADVAGSPPDGEVPPPQTTPAPTPGAAPAPESADESVNPPEAVESPANDPAEEPDVEEQGPLTPEQVPQVATGPGARPLPGREGLGDLAPAPARPIPERAEAAGSAASPLAGVTLEQDQQEAGAGAPRDEAADAGGDPQLLPRVIAIANQKGGVGKTTTAVNLGAALAEADFRVLVVDLDPQGNATTGLGINPRDVSNSIYDVIMHDTPALDCVEPTSLKNLFVIPATIDLAGAEIELVPAFSRELKLKRALEIVRSEYDYVLIDCPPSLGLLTVNGLAGADDVIVPIQCEYYALEGLGQLLRNVALVRSNLNPTLDVRGIVLTMHDSRTRLADQVEREVREHFGAKVYETVVPRTVRLSEAPSFGQPIIVFDSTSRGAQAYRALAKEVSSGATRRTG